MLLFGVIWRVGCLGLRGAEAFVVICMCIILHQILLNTIHKVACSVHLVERRLYKVCLENLNRGNHVGDWEDNVT